MVSRAEVHQRRWQAEARAGGQQGRRAGGGSRAGGQQGRRAAGQEGIGGQEGRRAEAREEEDEGGGGTELSKGFGHMNLRRSKFRG